MQQNNPQETDEEIARRVQSGQIELFGVLIERYERKMERYGRKFLSDSEDISDVLQEVFIKAYKNIRSFDGNRKFSSWLYRIAHNELVNALKKRNKRALPLFDFDVFFPHYAGNDNNMPDRQAERKEMREMLERCFGKINFKYREPIILYYFEELSYKEIADIMQIPVSTVGVRIKRAKETIKAILKKEGYVYK